MPSMLTSNESSTQPSAITTTKQKLSSYVEITSWIAVPEGKNAHGNMLMRMDLLYRRRDTTRTSHQAILKTNRRNTQVHDHSSVTLTRTTNRPRGPITAVIAGIGQTGKIVHVVTHAISNMTLISLGLPDQPSDPHSNRHNGYLTLVAARYKPGEVGPALVAVTTRPARVGMWAHRHPRAPLNRWSVRSVKAIMCSLPRVQ